MSFGSQLCPQAARAIALGMARKGGGGRRLPTRRKPRCPAQPLIVAGWADVEHAAEHLHRLDSRYLLDELITTHD
ncbi:MAG: hypothetical protein EOO61_01110 [Hymenobacter sp.]|nr:MAG: hypothetical protein EOO61_01110 [Hymenobacter sp.]